MNVSPSGRAAMVVALALASCRGVIEADNGEGGKPGGGPAPGGGGMGGPAPGGSPTPAPGLAEDPYAIGPSGLRRLTRTEYDNTLRDLLGDETRSGFAQLPEDVNDPFDNDYTDAAGLGRADRVGRDPGRGGRRPRPRRSGAAQRARRLHAHRPRRRRVPATLHHHLRPPRPAPPADRRRGPALPRRCSPSPSRARTSTSAVELVLRAMLQDPSFLYRVEIGAPVAGLPGRLPARRLRDRPPASPISCWGTTPDDGLLDLGGGRAALGTRSGCRAAAASLARRRRAARQRVERFHALWLGYHQLPFPADAGRRPARRDRRPGRAGDLRSERRDYLRALPRRTETFLTRHAGRALRPRRAGQRRRLGRLRRQPAARHPLARHGAVGGRQVRRHQPHPARASSCATACSARTSRRRRPTWTPTSRPRRSTSRCKVDRYAAHRSGGCAACHDRTGLRSASAWRTTTAPGEFRTADKDAPGVRHRRRRRRWTGVGDVQRAGRAGRAADPIGRPRELRGDAALPLRDGAPRGRRRRRRHRWPRSRHAVPRRAGGLRRAAAGPGVRRRASRTEAGDGGVTMCVLAG